MIRDEQASDLRADLERIIADRPVSVVGNAASLLTSRFGPLIDKGCVFRMNCGVPIRASAQGRRVDVHCFTNRPSFVYNMSRAQWRVRLKRRYFDGAYPVWMGETERETCDNPRQAFYPVTMLHALTAELGAKPSVGARVLHMLAELTQAELRIFGFDFKLSTSFYRTRENRGPHDWDAEREFALSLARQRGWSILN